MALFQRMGNSSHSYGTKFSLEAFSIEEEEFAAGETSATPLADAAAQGEGDIAEAAADAVEVSNDVDVMQEAMFALEDGEEIAAVQDQVDNATQNDIDNAAALQQTVMERVEGAGNVEDVPATESRVGGRISTEGFKEWIKAAWEKIKEFAGNIYHKIKMIWKKFVNGTGRLQKRAKALKDKLKDKKAKFKDSDAKITYSSAILAKTDSGKFEPSHASEAAEEVLARAKVIESELKDNVKAVKDAIKEPLDKSKIKDLSESGYTAMVKKAAKDVIDIKLKAANVKDFSLDKRFGAGSQTKYAPETFGNKGLFFSVNHRDSDGLGSVLNSFTCRFESIHKSFSGGKVKDNEHKPLEKEACQKIANSVEDGAKELEKFFDKGTGNVEKEIDTLKEDINKAVKEHGEADEFSSYGKEAAKGVQRAYVVPTQLLRAYVNYASYLVQLAGAALTVAEISVDKLEDDKKD